MRRPEPAYEWKLTKLTPHLLGNIHELRLVSQTWQETRWEHELILYQPHGVKPADTMVIYISGGAPQAHSTLLGLHAASTIGAPVAFLYQIPNQPLLGGKQEDELIAETFTRYLKTGDDSWPLLFPMVKSVLKAMDALQAYSQETWQQPLKKFILAGASKRGWTAWLAAATGDPRIKAIIPLVIDTLNMKEQLPHQFRSYGAFSDSLIDYTRAGLLPMPDTPAARKLWSMVDPYVYREQLKLPKMIINGSNDPYWSLDALNLYWNDLPGEKWLLYVPNAGHNLRQKLASGQTDFSRAGNTLMAFARHMTIDNPMPTLKWKHDQQNGKLHVEAEASEAPVSARLWLANSPTRDFRKAAWRELPAELKGMKASASLVPQEKGYTAYYLETEFDMKGLRYFLSTQIQITPNTK
jgi:PhoPQ-activated pathogenicity-related protein